MESYGLEMDDLFDDRHVDEDLQDVDEQLNTNSDDLAADEPNHSQENADDSNDGDISRQVANKLLQNGAAKKRVLRPQPKLDPARLTGERGIPILPKLFEGVKFKGKGHEVRDLNVLMKTLEHWGHRLFPKMPFDEIIDRVEKLGQKKPVQTILNRIRLDMPILSDDFVSQTVDDELDDNDRSQNDLENDYEEALKDTMNDSHVTSVNHSLTASTPYPKDKQPEDTVINAEPGCVSYDIELTEAQKERMRINQERARQKLLDRSSNNTSSVQVENEDSMDIDS